MSKLRHKAAKAKTTIPTNAELRKLDKPATLPRGGKSGGRKPSKSTKMK